MFGRSDNCFLTLKAQTLLEIKSIITLLINFPCSSLIVFSIFSFLIFFFNSPELPRKFHSWTPSSNPGHRSTTAFPPLLSKRNNVINHPSSGTSGVADLSASDSLLSETVHSMALDDQNAPPEDDYESDDSTEIPDILDNNSAMENDSYNVENLDKLHHGVMETAPVFSSRPHTAALQSLPSGLSQSNQCRRHYAHLKRSSSRRRTKTNHRSLMDTLLEQRIIIETEQLELFLRLRPATLRYDFIATDGGDDGSGGDSGTPFGTTVAPPQATTPSREEREEAGEQCLEMLKEQFEQSRSKLFELSTTTFNVSCHVVAPGTQLQCALYVTKSRLKL